MYTPEEGLLYQITILFSIFKRKLYCFPQCLLPSDPHQKQPRVPLSLSLQQNLNNFLSLNIENHHRCVALSHCFFTYFPDDQMIRNIDYFFIYSLDICILSFGEKYIGMLCLYYHKSFYLLLNCLCVILDIKLIRYMFSFFLLFSMLPIHFTWLVPC